jgi:hypothetical protein
MKWQKMGILAMTADASAMLLVFSVFGKFHYTIELEECSRTYSITIGVEMPMITK